MLSIQTFNVFLAAIVYSAVCCLSAVYFMHASGLLHIAVPITSMSCRTIFGIFIYHPFYLDPVYCTLILDQLLAITVPLTSICFVPYLASGDFNVSSGSNQAAVPEDTPSGDVCMSTFWYELVYVFTYAIVSGPISVVFAAIIHTIGAVSIVIFYVGILGIFLLTVVRLVIVFAELCSGILEIFLNTVTRLTWIAMRENKMYACIIIVLLQCQCYSA